MTPNRPEFAISDLHIGDGGPRDNFAAMNGGRREQEFLRFLDYVESQNGTLRIVGDLFELWQGNISAVITRRMYLLDRLAALGAVYMLGNHDIDLKYFVCGKVRLSHALFNNLISTPTCIVRNGRRIMFTHGHLEDKYCCGETPDMGRVSAIYTGLKEDKNGGPLLTKYGYRTVENDTLGRIFWLMNLWGKLLRRPNHGQVMRDCILQTWRKSGAHVLIYGHTHEPGQFYFRNGQGELPIYNLGTWAEQVNTFARIEPDGRVGLFDWNNGKITPNTLALPV